MRTDLLAHPEWALPALALLALVATLVGVAARRGRQRARRLLGARGEPLAQRARRRDAVLVAALAFLGLALVAPYAGSRSEITTASGIDLVVLVDPARRIAEDVLARLVPGDRAALAAFGDRGALLTPLTPDTDALLELLPALDTDLFRWRASRLAAGLTAAVRGFETESPRPRVVLLLGDGEDPDGRDLLDGAFAALAAQRVRVVAVALGTPAGALVPDGGVALRDAAGHDIVSHASPARLRQLADATGGELLPTDRFGAIDAEAALVRLRRDAGAAPGERIERRVPAARVAPFAALGFALLLAEAWPSRRAGKPSARASERPGRGAARGAVPGASPASRGAAQRRLRALAGIGAAIGLVVWAPPVAGERERDETEIAALEAAARARPGDAVLLLDLGLARARADRHGEASQAFLAAALSTHDPALAATAYYDLGVSALARADLTGARDAFFDALALAPDDQEARFNLEWTLHALAARPPPSETAAGATPPTAGGPGAAGQAQSAQEGHAPAAPPSHPGPKEPRGAGRERQSGSTGGAAGAQKWDATDGTDEVDGTDGTEEESEASDGGRPGEKAPPSLGPRDRGSRLERAADALAAERARRLLDGVADAPGLALRQLTREGAARERMRAPQGPLW